MVSKALLFLLFSSMFVYTALSFTLNNAPVTAESEILSFIDHTGNYFLENNLTRHASPKTQSSLQDLFNGMWEQAGLADPTTVMSCLQQITVQNATQLIGNVLSLATQGQFERIQQNITIFMNSFPQADLTCLQTNQEVHNLLNTLGFIGQPATVKMSQLGMYVAVNQPTISGYIQQANTNYVNNDLADIGKTFIKVIQAAFAKNK